MKKLFNYPKDIFEIATGRVDVHCHVIGIDVKNMNQVIGILKPLDVGVIPEPVGKELYGHDEEVGGQRVALPAPS